jgi:hypothetical protein
MGEAGHPTYVNLAFAMQVKAQGNSIVLPLTLAGNHVSELARRGWGLALASEIEENLAYTAHCLTMAERVRGAEEHEEWSRLARHWLKRALDSAEAELSTEG